MARVRRRESFLTEPTGSAGPRQGSGHATLPDVIRMMRSVADEEGLSPPRRTHEPLPGLVGNEVGQDLDLPVT
jgi:hypothetical protein